MQTQHGWWRRRFVLGVDVGNLHSWCFCRMVGRIDGLRTLYGVTEGGPWMGVNVVRGREGVNGC